MSWRVLAMARHFDLSPEPKQYLRDNSCEIVETEYGGSLNDGEIPQEKLIRMLDGVDACIISTPLMSREVIEKAKSLKLISRRGVGFDRVDVEAATENGVYVTITPGTVDEGVADHAFALMLAISKKIVESHLNILNGVWKASVGTELWQKTLGVIGMGRIGQAVARRAAGFDMKVIAYDVFPSEEVARKYGVTFVSLEELMQQSDFISINAPLNKDTFHLVSDRLLQMTKPSAFIVNTARGGLIDEAALVRALERGNLAGAALDVFEEEPLGSSRLKELPNVVLTAHTGGYTYESMKRANLAAAKNVVQIMKGVLPGGGALLNPEAKNVRQR